MPRYSAAHTHALEVLGTTWHPYEWALWEVSKGVPPNLAVRRAEEDRIQQYRKEHPGVPRSAVPPRSRPLSTDYLVKVGARTIARITLQNKVFEHVRHRETGQRLVRVRPKIVTPPPEGYEHWKKNTSKFDGWTKEQIDEFNRARSRKSVETRLRKQGIDPATHLTVAQKEENWRKWWANATEEERAEWRRATARKAWESRRKNQEKKKQK